MGSIQDADMESIIGEVETDFSELDIAELSEGSFSENKLTPVEGELFWGWLWKHVRNKVLFSPRAMILPGLMALVVVIAGVICIWANHLYFFIFATALLVAVLTWNWLRCLWEKEKVRLERNKTRKMAGEMQQKLVKFKKEQDYLFWRLKLEAELAARRETVNPQIHLAIIERVEGDVIVDGGLKNENDFYNE